MIQDVTEDLAKSFNLTETNGALVSGVKEGGPGAKGGLERGDIILEYGGQKVKSSHELPTLVAATPIGKEVDVKLLRDGKEKTLKVKIAELPKEAEEAAPGEKAESAEDSLGLRLGPVTPEIAKQLNVEPNSGVLVQGVKSGSGAEESGLQPGDVIQEVNRKPVKTAEAFKDAIGKVKEGQSALLLVHRGDSTLFLTFKR
jgi:serine protease Do